MFEDIIVHKGMSYDDALELAEVLNVPVEQILILIKVEK
jgi:hypothetical protein